MERFAPAPASLDRTDASSYTGAGDEQGTTLVDRVRHWRSVRPQGLAFAGEHVRLSWVDYDEMSTRLAELLVTTGLQPGDRLATLLPDGPEVHVAWLAAEKAGLVSVGIGSRAGEQEVRHLLDRSGASAVLTCTDAPVANAAAGIHISMEPMRSGSEWRIGPIHPSPAPATCGPTTLEERRLGARDLFLLNSTSGTTGLPKCVMHTQRRWAYFHQLAVDAGELTDDDVFCSAVASPFGFGLWTAHFTPTYLGSPCHLRRKFSPEALIELIATERVTVLAAVTTQLIMLLNSPALSSSATSSLRVIFTGGEAVPYARAAEFEDRTGARVLQFYGSNETGALSRTTTRDNRHRRLTTAGKIIDEMQVRLFDPVSGEPTQASQGQPACRGPAVCEGYYNDPAGNAALYTRDGWMLMGDLVEIDPEGYLTVIGRISDIIIRGGKNISAPAVEAEVMTHPRVALAAAVAMPDPVFGERVCLYAELRDGAPLKLEDLTAHLAARGVTKEWFPERLVVLDELPRSSGGKVAKAELRADIRNRITNKGGAEPPPTEGGNDQ